ncbi:type IV secretion protein Rhs [Enterobacillus tribolii]|uniref:type IV secretion protein Rhs n=1 Tax=Enterobacillus tribolii TaxID=1487935 RepID=UPI000E1CD88D|nr:type IV secretion protein Rhs [Enterobacillus tribolii]MBW7982182.1 type IV secretion protein Rhs [Enterobacillus tribolii]
MRQEQEEGIKRALTLGEITMARSVYGNIINYTKIVVHCDSYFPFGAQPKYTAMAPNGELWFRKELYWKDFAFADKEDQHTFIHEMAHVWQHQKGIWVRTRGLFSGLVSYYYKLEKTRLNDYGMEQQASIIADYWYLKTYGVNVFFC